MSNDIDHEFWKGLAVLFVLLGFCLASWAAFIWGVSSILEALR